MNIRRVIELVTYPRTACTPVVKLPRGWVPCPLCRQHYVVKPHWRLCSMVKED